MRGARVEYGMIEAHHDKGGGNLNGNICAVKSEGSQWHRGQVSVMRPKVNVRVGME